MTTPQTDRIAEIEAKVRGIREAGFSTTETRVVTLYEVELLLSRIRELEQGQRLKEMEWIGDEGIGYSLFVGRLILADIRHSSNFLAQIFIGGETNQNIFGEFPEAKAWCEQTVRAELLSLFTNQTKR